MPSNPPPSLTSPPWSERTKRMVALITVGLLALLLLQLWRAWSVVLVAALLAYLLYPIVNFIETNLLHKLKAKGLRRALAVLLTFALFLFATTLLFVLFLPPLVVQSQEFLAELPDFVSQYEQELEQNLSRPLTIGNQTIIPWEELNRLGGESESVNLDVVSAVREAASALSSPVVDIATIAVSFIFNLMLMLVIMFYLLKDGARFLDQLESITPVEYQGDLRRLFYELGIIWNAYLRGQLLLGFIIGVETFIAATVLGLPQPLVLALIAGILEFIPNLGPILSAVPAVLFALISPSTTIGGLEGIGFAVVVMATYAFIQQSEYLLLVPRVMGGSLDLHPLAILLAVISGAAIAGILGIILAAPTLATLRLILIYIWGKLLDIDPFAERSTIDIPTPPDEAVLSPSRTRALHSPMYPQQQGEIIED